MSSPRRPESYPAFYTRAHDLALEYPDQSFEIPVNTEAGPRSLATRMMNWLNSLEKHGTPEQKEQAKRYRGVKRSPVCHSVCGTCKKEREHKPKPVKGKGMLWICMACETELDNQRAMRVGTTFALKLRARDGEDSAIFIEDDLTRQEKAAKEKLIDNLRWERDND